jgi:uncharacterized protein YcaQ
MRQTMKAELSLRDARHVALAAQGFGPAGTGRAGRRALATLVTRLGCVQIDSVNVLQRSHYLPFYSRLGAYDTGLLDDLLFGPRRAFAEYWAHEASIVNFERWSLLRWRMERARSGRGTWGRIARINATEPALVERVRARIERDGALAASDFEDARSQGSWWGWSDTKLALEYLFWSGIVTTRRRRLSFEREYDLVERVIPGEVLARSIAAPEAQRELMLVALRALGVATESELRDYFRLDLADARQALGELVEARRVIRIGVESWKAPAYAIPPFRIPRKALGRALLSPFDNLIWNRPRAQHLFAFDFRLEIYTPVAKRVHGYYVLPYLVDGRLVARVDLKHDRAASTVRAHAIHLEHGVRPAAISSALQADLQALAAWLGAEHTAIPSVKAWK